MRRVENIVLEMPVVCLTCKACRCSRSEARSAPTVVMMVEPLTCHDWEIFKASLEAIISGERQEASLKGPARNLASFRKDIKPYIQSGTTEAGKANLWPVVDDFWHVLDSTLQLIFTNRCKLEIQRILYFKTLQIESLSSYESYRLRYDLLLYISSILVLVCAAQVSFDPLVTGD